MEGNDKADRLANSEVLDPLAQVWSCKVRYLEVLLREWLDKMTLKNHRDEGKEMRQDNLLIREQPREAWLTE